ncbi:MAG: PD40 domain-containing protein [Saprospiraceae bacterium]|nr:PD40 domain-containing protein [Saprospiraceae bacterium]MCB9327022.1 PD40 domain-containing protein [Lewinellaceae bacterium]
MKKILYCVLVLLMAAPPVSNAQNTKHKLNEAKEFFYHEKYAEALSILNSSRKLSRLDKEARLLIAICNYQLNHLDLALTNLLEITAEKKEPYPECWLYLGKVLHAMHKFDEAADYYKLYLRTIRPDHPHRQMVREEIRRCANGIDVQYRQPLAIVENLGMYVNTVGDEFAPVPSKNLSNKLYFSSSRYGNAGGPRDEQNRADERFGSFLSDMFSCSVTGGQWSDTAPMHFLLNSPQNEVLLDFDKEGSVMYYFKGWSLRRGEIIADTFKTIDNRTLNSTPFLAPLDVANGDNELCLYNDTLLIFASRRQGGYGGYDLYRSVFLKGYWSDAQNLGPAINTAYDETSPYLAPDGKTLYFSSNDSRKSIGGFDIFKSVYVQQAARWSELYNMGIPLNSAGDDTGFRLTRDGFTAFLASSRKDGFGKRDLYIAYFQEYLPEVEAPVVAYAPPAEKIREYDKPIIISQSPGFVKEEPLSTPEPPPAQMSPSIRPAAEEKPVAAYGPLYLDGSSSLDYSQKQNLDPIATLLLDHPGVTVIITAYTMKPGVVPQRLFRAINYGEEAAAYLQSKGVPATAIYMRALDGSQVGNTKPYVIEFSFVGTKNTDLNGTVPVLGEAYHSEAPGLITGKDLFYKVQISSVTRELTRPVLDEQPYPMIEKTPDFAYYRYTLGAFEQYEAAKAFALEMQRKGQSGAYVVPFINGKRADKNEAKRNAGNFPDLDNYLKG